MANVNMFYCSIVQKDIKCNSKSVTENHITERGLIMDYKIFREHMRQLCDSTGKPLREIAEGLKISAATLSRYLTGDRLPEITYLVKVADHFHVSLDWLVGLSGDKYELMPPELQEVASLYGAANADDKRVVQAVLNKYRLEEKDDGENQSGC